MLCLLVLYRGYAFVEFETKEAADEAAHAVNLFDLGGQFLRVGRVTVAFTAILRVSWWYSCCRRTVNMELLANVTPESTTVSRFIPSTSEDQTLLQSTQY